MSGEALLLATAIEAAKEIVSHISDEVEKKKMMDYIGQLERALEERDINIHELIKELDKIRKDLIFKTDEAKKFKMIITNRDNKILELEAVISQLKGGAI